MQAKQLLAIALPGLLLIPALPPKPANANPAAAVIAACGAQPEICAIVGAAAGTWILWNSGRHYWCTAGQCQPTRRSPYIQSAPRAFYTKREQHGAVKRSDCQRIAARFKRAGRRVRLVDVQPNHLGSGGVLEYICIFEGEDAEEGWYGR